MARDRYVDQTCGTCGGSGKVQDWTNRRWVKCNTCGGTGKIKVKIT